MICLLYDLVEASLITLFGAGHVYFWMQFKGLTIAAALGGARTMPGIGIFLIRNGPPTRDLTLPDMCPPGQAKAQGGIRGSLVLSCGGGLWEQCAEGISLGIPKANPN